MSVLQSKGLSLRAVEAGDTEVIYSIENDTSGWMQSENYLPFSKSVLDKYTSGEHDLFKHCQYRFMICMESNSEVCGCIDLFDYSSVHSRAGVGIYILDEFRNLGYAGTALEMLIDYSKNHLNLRLLHCSILEDNLNSVKLFSSKGFVKTGKRENWYLMNLEFKSTLLFQKEL